MCENITIKRTERGKLLPVVAKHLIHHGALSVHDLIVREGENIIFRKRILHGKRQAVVLIFAEQVIRLHVFERIVHKAHVPLKGKAQTSVIGRLCHQRIGGAFFRNHHGAGEAGQNDAV